HLARRGGSGGRGRRRGAGFQGGQRVALGDAAVLAGAGDGARVELVLGDHALRGGREHRSALRRLGRGSQIRERRRLRRGFALLRFGLGFAGRRGGGGGRLLGRLSGRGLCAGAG